MTATRERQPVRDATAVVERWLRGHLTLAAAKRELVICGFTGEEAEAVLARAKGSLS